MKVISQKEEEIKVKKWTTEKLQNNENKNKYITKISGKSEKVYREEDLNK